MLNDQQQKHQLQLDIKQLKHLVLETQNQRVGEFLAGKLAQAKAHLQLLSNTAKPVQVTPPTTQPKSQFISIHKFAWENVEGAKKVKQFFPLPSRIMINLQGIKKQCQPSQIHTEFTSNSVTIKINQFKDKNYIFSIPKLYKEIDPQKCSFNLTTNYLNIKLQKKQYGQWIDINWKKDIFSQDREQEKGNKGPMKEQEKLMDMMKKMYQEGDPQMQKVIKEAFQNSQDKKKPGQFW